MCLRLNARFYENTNSSYHKCVPFSSCQTRAEAARSNGELWFPALEITAYVNVASQSLCASDSESEVSTDRLVHC